MLWFSILNKSSDWTFSCFQSIWGKDWVWSRTAAGQGMGSRAGKWCGRQVGWLCGGSCRGWRGHFGYVPLALLSSVCLNSIQLYFLNPIWFCKFSIQVSQWRAHPRLRLNVMIRETAPVTWGTGPQNRANMLFMCSVRMRTSSSALSWLKSYLLQEKTSTLTR